MHIWSTIDFIVLHLFDQRVILLNNDKSNNVFFFCLFVSRWHLDSKVEWKTIPTSQCSILLHIQSFQKHHDTDSKHPKKLSRAKILSLSLSFSFKRAQLSVTHSATKKKRKKSLRNLVVSKWKGGENCAFLPWPWSGIVVSENTNTPPPLPPPPSKRVLRPHYTQVWVKVITWQWSNS